MINTEDYQNALNQLLEYLHDSHNGYKECASEISDISLKQLFNDLAGKRLTMINDIQDAMSSISPDITDNGSITGALHRTFIDIKSFVTNGDKNAIVEEVKRGENTTIEQYEKTLQYNLPLDIDKLLQQQLLDIKSNLAMVETMAQL